MIFVSKNVKKLFYYEFKKWALLRAFIDCLVSYPVELKLGLHTTHPPDFWYNKNADNIYSGHKNQVPELCVSGDMVILQWTKPKIKCPYLCLHRSHALDFWCSNRYCQHL